MAALTLAFVVRVIGFAVFTYPPLAAVEAGDTEALRRHLEAGGVDLSRGYVGRLGIAEDPGGWTLLHFAADRADPGAVRLLLEHGADPNARDNGKATPIYRVIDHEPSEPAIRCLRLLLAGGARLDVENGGWRMTPLSYAVWRARPEYASLLIEAGTPVNQRGIDGNTPLLYACQLKERPGTLECVRLLLAAGADPLLANTRGGTPLDADLERDSPAIAALLREAIARRGK